MAAKKKAIHLEVAGRKVRVSSPDKPYFPERGITKLDLVNYYLSVGEGVLRGVRNRPIILRRYIQGVAGDGFFQKRAPKSRPDWIDTVRLSFPSGRQADEVVINDLAQLVWVVNLGCLDLNPHPVRADDLDHPDELRVDLDPGPGVTWEDVQRVALVVREVLADHGLVGWPKTSGSRGIHVYVRIERRWEFTEVRRAALALAREVARRAPELATAKWWKEERHGVFLDYNQNARDRTIASVYSVRPVAAATVSAPLTWDEVPDCHIADFTPATVKARYERLGDVGAGIDETPGVLDSLLELSDRQEAEGEGDAPWPPHYQKQPNEPPRVQPSRRKKGRRVPKFPLITVAKAEHKDDALEGLQRWKVRHPEAAAFIEVEDVLVDAMRGRYRTWTRIRLNLRNVPEDLRPPQETPDPDYDPWAAWQEE
jgi:DNA ligase D-like protein (predicted polymerase)